MLVSARAGQARPNSRTRHLFGLVGDHKVERACRQSGERLAASASGCGDGEPPVYQQVGSLQNPT